MQNHWCDYNISYADLYLKNAVKFDPNRSNSIDHGCKCSQIQFHIDHIYLN